MIIPDTAIDAALAAVRHDPWCGTYERANPQPCSCQTGRLARAAVEDAMPAIREAIAQEILSLQPRHMIRWMNEVGASDMSVKAATAYVRHIAERIVRGSTP